MRSNVAVIPRGAKETRDPGSSVGVPTSDHGNATTIDAPMRATSTVLRWERGDALSEAAPGPSMIPATRTGAARAHHSVLRAANRPRSANTPRPPSFVHGTGRARRASITATAASEAKNNASPRWRIDGGCHSVTVLRIVGF